MSNSSNFLMNRRQILQAGAAIAGAAMLPWNEAAAQQAGPFIRYNVADPRGQKMLEGYATAIKNMLALDPSHRHHWYRFAFTHFFDCPHGNWWFLVWHRAFTGYAERIVRKYSGMKDFAFPYWDWTASPEVPLSMYEGVLDPNNEAFIGSAADFRSRMDRMFAKEEGKDNYWVMDPDPKGDYSGTRFSQLLSRSYRFPEDVWFDIFKNPNTVAFFGRGSARGLKRDNRSLSNFVKNQVSQEAIEEALSPRDFETFSGGKTLNHHIMSTFGILEGKPHNKVHNEVGGIVYTDAGEKTTNNGGFLQANLSPIDPLFFLHHANIDRLWDVWTRTQKAAGGEYLPQGTDKTTWSEEPFLFFIDENEGWAEKTKAGDYADISFFNYTYEDLPAQVSSKALVAAATSRKSQRREIQSVSSEPAESAAPAKADLGVPVTLPTTFLSVKRGLRKGPDAPLLFAKVTLGLPHAQRGAVFNILIHAGDPAKARVVDSVSLFGGHGGDHGPVTFTVAISKALVALGGIPKDRTIYFQAAAAGEQKVQKGGAHDAGHGQATASALSVTVEEQ
jgi:hypothetical protein